MSFALAHATTGMRHVVSVVTSLEAKDPAAAAVKLARAATRRPEQVRLESLRPLIQFGASPRASC